MILDNIIAHRKKDVEERKKIISEEGLYKKVEEKSVYKLKDMKGNTGFREALGEKGFNIIGEVKKASPSKGIIVEDFNVGEIARFYDKLPVKAISVLTEEKYFQGHPDYVACVRSMTSKPILRKDFIVDRYQIYETFLMGCQGILLIAAVLGDKLGEYYKTSLELGIEPLVEVHDEKEMYNALKCGSRIIGINNRNLQTFEVDLGTTERLVKLVQGETIIISESGIRNEQDISYLKSLNVNGALIGETFMLAMKEGKKLEGFF
ncbi:indole-3-glycerol phosphate synthase [Hathewaya proteolytica DSM 3090]|uniref:indole-3-glycerol-phosphate synthase n=1 Tax=Hathewaya proteolytica DSM 3090 TaxID=1121331 RepID=A0A1M6K6J6_9CLOT|nr:indole-3-glycerol phosphate synthase TrpC [Hathewaya proteolytica]SHJ54626.1 indole-3-glycerol phosphate synthase [Hathewaya proteolytica DSM 3090]